MLFNCGFEQSELKSSVIGLKICQIEVEKNLFHLLFNISYRFLEKLVIIDFDRVFSEKQEETNPSFFYVTFKSLSN